MLKTLRRVKAVTFDDPSAFWYFFIISTFPNYLKVCKNNTFSYIND